MAEKKKIDISFLNVFKSQKILLIKHDIVQKLNESWMCETKKFENEFRFFLMIGFLNYLDSNRCFLTIYRKSAIYNLYLTKKYLLFYQTMTWLAMNYFQHQWASWTRFQWNDRMSRIYGHKRCDDPFSSRDRTLSGCKLVLDDDLYSERLESSFQL